MAWAFVAHTDSRFDPEMLCRYVLAYQEIQPLTIGELWALAITLRIVLIENLRRLAESVVRSRLARQEADTLADRLLGVSGMWPNRFRPRSPITNKHRCPTPSLCSSSIGCAIKIPRSFRL